MDYVAKQYANAIASIAIEENRIAEYEAKAKCLKAVFAEQRDFGRLLGDVNIEKKTRFAILDRCFASLQLPSLLALIKVVIDNHRINIVDEILREFIHLLHKKQQIAEGIVYSVYPLDEQMMKKIEHSIGESLATTVALENRLDTSLLGGVKVVINETIYDGSIKNKLHDMRQMLLKVQVPENEN